MTLYELSPEWNAVVMDDGQILLQHRVGVMRDTGATINLSEVSEETAQYIQEVEPNGLLVRCFVLLPDGSLQADQFGISPQGVPAAPYSPFPSAMESAAAHIQRFQQGFVAEQAMERYEASVEEIDVS